MGKERKVSSEASDAISLTPEAKVKVEKARKNKPVKLGGGSMMGPVMKSDDPILSAEEIIEKHRAAAEKAIDDIREEAGKEVEKKTGKNPLKVTPDQDRDFYNSEGKVSWADTFKNWLRLK